jgi:hypothetical protein
VRSIPQAFLLAAIGSAGAADEDRTHAIISLLGDGLSIVVRENYVSDAHASTSNVHPWDTLTSQQKVSALQSMVRQEAGRIVTTLLQQR